jgi:AraC-like DNA-binding protein
MAINDKAKTAALQWSGREPGEEIERNALYFLEREQDAFRSFPCESSSSSSRSARSLNRGSIEAEFLFEQLLILAAGFSVLSAVILFVAYAFFLSLPAKSWDSLASCAVLLAALAVLQLGHLRFIMDDFEPLNSWSYLLALFATPPAFYFFSRSVIMPGAPKRYYLLLNLLPFFLVFLFRKEIALPLLFLAGAAFSLWLALRIYDLRKDRKRFGVEFFFFSMFSIMAIAVLGFGLAIPYIDSAYFYYFYCSSIGLAFFLIVALLIGFPDLIGDISESGRVKYAASTLTRVDVGAALRKLEEAMNVSKLYQEENLNLASLAQEIGLTSHQLSELVNAQLGMSFSRYIRRQRVEAAKALLADNPKHSILSIGIETGFRSQSNFYAAFKEFTGQSPGEYRAQTRK